MLLNMLTGDFPLQNIFRTMQFNPNLAGA